MANGAESAADAMAQPAGKSPVQTQYIYEMAGPEANSGQKPSCQIMARRHTSGKSSAEGGALFGEKIIVALIHKKRGSGSKRHTHPNEQFNFVLQGTLLCDIDDQALLCPAGHCIHIPAGIEHSCVATGDEDVVYMVAKDTRHGIAGPPVDGIEDGPRFLPSFGPDGQDGQGVTKE